MSQPISILNTENADQLVSPGESLTKSFGARQIVDNVCGSNNSPVSSFGKRLFNNINNYHETPDFQLSDFINQGMKVIGPSASYPFGTPPRGYSAFAPSWNIHQNIPSLFAPIRTSLRENAEMYSTKDSLFSFFENSQQNISETSLMSELFNSESQSSMEAQNVPIRDNSLLDDDLLKTYRENPSSMKHLKLSDIRGRLLDFAKDQVGSRFIQQKLETSDLAEKDSIFNEVIRNCPELVNDIFGNYVVQKFFEYGEYKHWVKLVDVIVDKVPQYTFQMYACRVLQKALEKVNEPLQIRILDNVHGIVTKCMKDQNGNHVIQKAIEKVSPHHVQFIINTLLSTPNMVYEMSMDPYGCRVIQRCLEHCVPSQTRPIIERLHKKFAELSINQYGNYVIQNVLQHGMERDKLIIVRKISRNILQLSTHKYASNVIEKCLELGSVAHKSIIVKSACVSPERMLPIVVQMMKDQYANYVVQKMFDQVTTEQRRELTQSIKPHIPLLKQFPYGKHILAKLDKYIHKSDVIN